MPNLKEKQGDRDKLLSLSSHFLTQKLYHERNGTSYAAQAHRAEAEFR